MDLFLSVMTALSALAAAVLTVLARRRASYAAGWWGGACFCLALSGALLMDIEWEWMLLASLALAALSVRKGRGERR